jgi:hypothetical protein
MNNFINKQIIKTSIFSALNAIVWVTIASILFYGFTFWIHPSGSDWVVVVLFDIAFLALFFTYAEKIIQGMGCLFNVKNHKTYKTFKEYGNIIEIKNKIEKEISNGQKQFPKTIFTQNWIIKNCNLDFDCVNIWDISWAYEKKTTAFLNFVVPVNTDYSIIIHTKNKQEVEFPVTKFNVSRFLDWIISQNQDARIGFSDENKIWSENQNI